MSELSASVMTMMGGWGDGKVKEVAKSCSARNVRSECEDRQHGTTSKGEGKSEYFKINYDGSQWESRTKLRSKYYFLFKRTGHNRRPYVLLGGNVIN